MVDTIKKIKKCLFLISLISVCVIMGTLMFTIFVHGLYDHGWFLCYLLTMAIICCASFFGNNALEVIFNKKVLSLTSIAMLIISSILGLIIFWGFLLPDKEVPKLFAQITGVLAIATCFFIMIIGTNDKLSGRLPALRFVYFGLIVAIDIILDLCIFGIHAIKAMSWPVFILICLAALTLAFVTAILGKRFKASRNEIEDGYMKIKKSEYQELLAKIKELEEENAFLKENK